MQISNGLWLIAGGIIISVILLAIALNGDGGGAEASTSDVTIQDAPSPHLPERDTPEQIAAAEQEARDTVRTVPLPEGAPPPPVSGYCSTRLCAINQVDFAERNWPLAWRGDYQGQRNVAECLGGSCFGAVLADESTACAWRFVIIETNTSEADDTDAANLQSDCVDLLPAQKELAARKAGQIIDQMRQLGS